jgi:hypothetical protein
MTAATAAATAAIQATDAAPDATGWQKVGRSLAEVGARVAEKLKWRKGRIYNPKILVQNIKVPERKICPPPNWARDVAEEFDRKRVVGVDVSLPYFMMVINQIEKIALDGHGYVHRALRSLGRLAKLGRRGVEGSWGRETVRKVMDWLREHGRIGPMNALYRDPETRELKRDANVYQLFSNEDAAEISAIEDPSARALKRESLTLSRGAVLWGLEVRPWGLNATPLASNRHEILRTPAPA